MRKAMLGLFLVVPWPSWRRVFGAGARRHASRVSAEP